MNGSLSSFEMQLVTDPDVLLVKNKIIQRVCDIYGELAEVFKDIVADEEFTAAESNNAKISKGENYKGLPYVILDYPRHFSKTGILAIRSFFWWGNFFSITLHLSGNHLTTYTNTIVNNISKLANEGWSINASEEQWEHDFGSENYIDISPKSFDLTGRQFLKLAKKIPLQEWDSINEFYTESFRTLVTLLQTKHQYGETNP